MSDTPARDALARAFHEAYERLAPDHGYQTRRASAVPWEAVPEANKTLMLATIGDVLADPSKVIAALVEAGWRPSDDELRAMGGRPGRYPGGMCIAWRFTRPASGFSPYAPELTEDDLAFIEDIAASDLPVWQPRSKEATDG